MSAPKKTVYVESHDNTADHLLLTVRLVGYDDEKREPVDKKLLATYYLDRVSAALVACDLSQVKPGPEGPAGVWVRAKGKDGEFYNVYLDPTALTQARRLQKKACQYCGNSKCCCHTRYPQGWHYYPGDVCKHGTYVGGIGVDWICGACESGED